MEAKRRAEKGVYLGYGARWDNIKCGSSIKSVVSSNAKKLLGCEVGPQMELEMPVHDQPSGD
eukprot:5167281-Prymnesium_polylepis.1